MRIPKVPIGALMLAVVFTGISLAELRGLLAILDGPVVLMGLIFFGPSLLTLGNFLAFLFALRLPGVWRTGRLQAGSFWWGFQVASWASLAGLGLICMVLEPTYLAVPFWRGGPTLQVVLVSIGNLLPDVVWINEIAEPLVITTIFNVPILALGLLAGLVSWALGIEVEVQFRRRRRGEPGAVAEPAPRESLAPRVADGCSSGRSNHL